MEEYREIVDADDPMVENEEMNDKLDITGDVREPYIVTFIIVARVLHQWRF